MMQKVVISGPGSYEKLQIRSFPDLSPQKETEVLVDVHCVGVNYADCSVRMGLYQSAKEKVGWPITPGFEFSGVVKASRSKRFRQGDSVFGVTFFNGYASQVCVPEHQLFAFGKELTYEQAAGFPAVFLTAYYALFELCRLRPGMKVLVHSAAGGVGSALVQLARWAKTEVTGVVGRTDKLEYLQSLKPDHWIDKSRENLWARCEAIAPDGFHVILDANGVETLKQSFKHLTSTGRLVVYGFHTMMPKKGGKPNLMKLILDYFRTPRFNPIQMTTENKSVMAFNLSYLFNQKSILSDSINHLLSGLKKKELHPPKVTVYPFKDVKKAHQALESGRTTGKLILKI